MMSSSPPADLPLDLAVILPTFNERANIDELVERLTTALASLRWEIIFVDDDSMDGTADLIAAHAQADGRIRLLQRIGRRGLSSACIEGILSTSARFVAVMDADLQHDESLLPLMFAELRDRNLDVVVGTRNASGGSMGDFAAWRVLLSRAGKAISKLISHCDLSDPMSGFFAVDRAFFLKVVRGMHGGGFKILLDMLASSPEPVKLGELGYHFRQRRNGSSKLDFNTGAEYLTLLVSKLTGGVVPTRFVLFALVGTAGLATHLLCLSLLMVLGHMQFLPAQWISAVVAMTENFFFNNLITFSDRRLRGASLMLGLASFWLACSFGAWANVVIALSLFKSGLPWQLAGLAGVVVSFVWNYSMTSMFTWQKAARPRLNSETTRNAASGVAYQQQIPDSRSKVLQHRKEPL